MQKINVVIIYNTPTKMGVEMATIEDKLDNFYSIMNCDTIDIIERKINGVYYNIIIDDEGLLKENKITLVEKERREILVGTIIVCPINYDNEEELGSFDKEKQKEFFYSLLRHPYYEF